MSKEIDEREGLPSASSMDRVVACPGSYLAEKAFPSTSNSASTKGTKIHEVLEGKRAMDSLGFSEKICAERIMFEEAYIINKYSFEGALMLREKRLWWFDEAFNKVFSAKPDVIMVNSAGHCLVINYKTGWYETTPVKVNMQVAAEALCVWHNLKISKIVGGLIHPNVTPTRQLRRFRRNELIELGELLQARAKEALEPNAERNAGPQCTYCKAKVDCAAYTEWKKQ